MAFVTFRLEEFAFALQEKYNRETWSRTGTESSQFSVKVGSIVPNSCCIAILFGEKSLRHCISVISIASEIAKVVGFVGLLLAP